MFALHILAYLIIGFAYGSYDLTKNDYNGESGFVLFAWIFFWPIMLLASLVLNLIIVPAEKWISYLEKIRESRD